MLRAQVVELYQQLRRACLPGGPKRGGPGPCGKLGAGAGPVDPAQMFAEIAARGTYRAQVQRDTAKYGPTIEGMIRDVSGFKADDMPRLAEFVGTADAVLDELCDETAVLRNFEWPAPRFDAFREAVALWRELTDKRDRLRHWQCGKGKRPDKRAEIQKYMVSCVRWAEWPVGGGARCAVHRQNGAHPDAAPCARRPQSRSNPRTAFDAGQTEPPRVLPRRKGCRIGWTR